MKSYLRGLGKFQATKVKSVQSEKKGSFEILKNCRGKNFEC